MTAADQQNGKKGINTTESEQFTFKGFHKTTEKSVVYQ